jgi:hypothetical protein
MSLPMLQTARLLLRPLQEDDAERTAHSLRRP